ncbi:MAG TPA: Do family serine endopeptidase [Xanthobacteraceae bacterium]|nr:Do family serine endopeptidase [Xanthobacteraceae bacterium]
MTDSVNPTSKPRGVLSARRIALLATTVAGFGAAAFFFAPDVSVRSTFPTAQAQNLSQQAQTAQRPVGFADIVERVKPAVISVRVRVDAPRVSMQQQQNAPFPQGSPMDRFFRRFGEGDEFGQAPDSQRGPSDGQRNQPEQRGQRAVPTPPGGGGRGTTGQGSGFFITADGYAVTNNHVVDRANNVQVTADDGRTYQARVIGTDPRTDLALIKVDGRTDFPFVTLAEGSPRIGDWVLAVGNPFGLGGTVTAGIVSANGRDIGAGPYDDFIQIDAPVNRGNSGGPTFDVNGHVIGVNTAIFSPSGGNVGIAFAIPASTVRSVVAQLRDRGSVTRGWIGVQIQPVTAEIADSLNLKSTNGALVAEPQAGSPAVTAGIRAGDIITQVNGTPVRDARELARTIGSMPPNTSVKLTVMRGGAEQAITLTLGELPNQREANAAPAQRPENRTTEVPRLGLTLAPVADVAGSGNEGVVITNVEQGSVAAEHGFRQGDVILNIANKPVTSPAEVRDMFADAQKGGARNVLVRVKSGDSIRFVAVRLGRA